MLYRKTLKNLFCFKLTFITSQEASLISLTRQNVWPELGFVQVLSLSVKVWLRIRFIVPSDLLNFSETFLKDIFNVFALSFISVKLQLCFVLTLQNRTKIRLKLPGWALTHFYFIFFIVTVQKHYYCCVPIVIYSIISRICQQVRCHMIVTSPSGHLTSENQVFNLFNMSM